VKESLGANEVLKKGSRWKKKKRRSLTEKPSIPGGQGKGNLKTRSFTEFRGSSAIIFEDGAERRLDGRRKARYAFRKI